MKNLSNVMEVKIRELEAIERRYMETSKTIDTLISENDKLHQSYYEVLKEMQFRIREDFQCTFNDKGMMNLKRERQEKELQLRSIKLQKTVVVIEEKRKKLAEEIEENYTENSSHQEQRKANLRMMKLADDHKREMKKLHKKILFLEKLVTAIPALELQKKCLKEQLNVMRRMSNAKGHQKTEVLHRKLKEEEEELEDLKSLSRLLSVKERLNSDEQQETRTELIKVLKKLPQAADIGVKRIGELDYKPFYKAAKRKYDKTIAEERALDLCSTWEEYLRDPKSHPFKRITINGISQDVVDKNDGRSKSLKIDLGDKVYKVVTNSLK